jgi:hypothetical protein
VAKKNLRKIPKSIREEIAGLNVPELVVGCTRTYLRAEIEAGALKHLGIALGPDSVAVPSAVIPEATRGKYSRRNREGYVVIRRDLPKERNEQPHDVPSWGSKTSTHIVWLPHPRFPRDIIAPTLAEVEMACVSRDSNSDSLVFSFRVNEPLSPAQEDFDAKLLANLNLLQENIGQIGIEPAKTPLADYIKTLHVSWEILPPGTREEAIERVFSGRQGTSEERQKVGDRYDFFLSLGATRQIRGLSGFHRYFGALLPSGIALFENIHYGNAIYVFFSGWERMSRMSRTALMTGRHGIDFSRIQHRSGWQDTVRRVLADAEKRLG